MLTNYKQKAFRPEKKSPLPLLIDAPEYRRVKYSLRLALRVKNASFVNFKIVQYNQPAITFDKENERTSVECWLRADDQLKEHIISHQGIIFPPDQPAIFTVGSIVHRAQDLPIDTSLTFFLFKVVIGRAKCCKDKKPPTQCPDGYDSVFMEKEEGDSNIYSHKYAIYNYERVQLIHKVDTKIIVDIVKEVAAIPDCAICGDPATQWCENDQLFFCENDDQLYHEPATQQNNEVKDYEKIQEVARVAQDHKRYPIEQMKKDFDMCQNHPKNKNEYFNNATSQALCSMCVIDGLQKTADYANSIKNSQQALVDIEKAFKFAYSEANKDDTQLEAKKQILEKTLNDVKNKVNFIKKEAVDSQKQITKSIEELLVEIHQKIEKQTDIYKSDRQELIRQYQEIQFAQSFLRQLAKDAAPLEFLKLNAGNAQVKDSIASVYPKISGDIIAMNGNDFDSEAYEKWQFIQLKTDKNTKQEHWFEIEVDEASNKLKTTKNQKTILRTAIEKARDYFRQGETEQVGEKEVKKVEFKRPSNMRPTNYTTKFRETLFERHTKMEETPIFNKGQSIKEEASKIPHPAKQVNDLANPAHQDEERKVMAIESQGKVEKLFKQIDQVLKLPEFGGIVEDSIKCSVFGVFGKNYAEFLKSQPKIETHRYLNYFEQSDILTEDVKLNRALLYFNFPYLQIVENQLKPELIFQINTAKDESIQKDMGDLIEKFEGYGNKNVTPSVILMKVEALDENKKLQSYIIGGYASHSWLISVGNGSGNGDDSCFLFNLTLNLRLNARKAKPFYQHSTKDKICFGNTDLVVSKGGRRVTSDITLPKGEETGSYFSFGNDLTQKNQVKSIIPSCREFKPSKLEIWTFK